MTNDEILAVVQAHKEGKQIQYKHKNGYAFWVDVNNGDPIQWNFQHIDYRVKPDGPRIFWLNIKESNAPFSNTAYGYTTKKAAKVNFYSGEATVPFVELTPEIEKLLKEKELI